MERSENLKIGKTWVSGKGLPFWLPYALEPRYLTHEDQVYSLDVWDFDVKFAARKEIYQNRDLKRNEFRDEEGRICGVEFEVDTRLRWDARNYWATIHWGSSGSTSWSYSQISRLPKYRTELYAFVKQYMFEKLTSRNIVPYLFPKPRKFHALRRILGWR